MVSIKRTNIEAGGDGGNAANEHDASSSKKPRSSTSAASAATFTSPASVLPTRHANADRDQLVLSQLGDFGIFGGVLP